MRAFLALEISHEMKSYLDGVSERMARRVKGIKWVHKEGRHITLKFFGEISDMRSREIRDALLCIEKKHDPFVVSIKSVGAFPAKRRARVIVATLHEGIENTKSLFNDMEEALLALDMEPEARVYNPHITLGRAREPVSLLDKDIEVLDSKSCVVDRAVLFQSTLTSTGAVYTPCWDIKLGGGA